MSTVFNPIRHPRDILKESERFELHSHGVFLRTEYLGGPEFSGRNHRVESGNGGKLLFQRRGNRGSHCFRACSRKICGHRNHWKINSRQITERELPVGKQPCFIRQALSEHPEAYSGLAVIAATPGC